MVRLAEVQQSIDLLLAAGGPGPRNAPPARQLSGRGQAEIETPRGRAALSLTLVDGDIVDVRIDTPSNRLAALVETVTRDRELADALFGVASLDLSPWELAQ